MSRKKIALITGAIALVLLIGLGAYGGWRILFRMVPGPYDQPGVSIAEYFKYGSIGTEPAAGIPYWIWIVLPEIFPEYLPGPDGYASLGMIWQEGQPTPIGITKQDIGIVPRAGLNCAICHTSVYRKTAAESKPTIVLGGAAQGFDVLSYQRFLFEAASDERFNADIILNKISKASGDFSWFERLLYRYAIIPGTKKALLENKEIWNWTYKNPPWGPGRIDPFNPVKFGLLEQPVDATIGTSDMLSIWNMKIREGAALHWDGLNSSLTEVVLSSTIGDGTTADALDLGVMARIQEFLEELPPPVFPYDIDDNLAEAGQTVFGQNCAICHTPGHGRTGQVIPVTEIGTDRHRADMWGGKDAAAYNAKYEDYEWGFSGFQDIDGYTAMPLDGIWLRAPYLHNGSVPSLKDLLVPPSSRPKRFYRGNDVYDPDNVGFISDVLQHAETAQPFFEFDTTLRGNSNQGHTYGTELSPEDKTALIEYLKTQ